MEKAEILKDQFLKIILTIVTTIKDSKNDNNNNNNKNCSKCCDNTACKPLIIAAKVQNYIFP